MKRHLFVLVTAIFLAVFPISAKSDELSTKAELNPKKNCAPDGTCNCVFSPSPIPRGQEETVMIRNDFLKPQPVYARCYFIEPVGKIEPENFRHELWIDGMMSRKTLFEEPPDQKWDQISVWITSEDYTDVINALEPGEHTIELRVYKKEEGKEKKDAKRDVLLSWGSFLYVVLEQPGDVSEEEPGRSERID